MISVGKGKYKVWLKEKVLGNGIILIVGGGEVSHIGSIVFTESGKKSKIIKIPGHKEEKIARDFAEKICLKKKVPILCVCGMHINSATKKDIKILVSNAKTLLKKYLG
jgi:hypothetical protein